MGHRIQFLKGTNEGPFNQSLAPNGASSFREDLNFFPIALIVKTTSYDGSQLGWQAGSSDTIPKEDHIRTTLSKFGSNWLSSFKHFPVWSYVITKAFVMVTQADSPDIIVNQEHLRTIPTKFGPNWLSSFRKEF